MDIQVAYDGPFLLADIRGEGREDIANKVRAYMKSNPLDNPVNVRLRTCGFVLRRRSKVIGRSRGLIISSVGYIDLPHDEAVKQLRTYKLMNLYDLFKRSDRWSPGEARVTAVIWRDSVVSGIIAKRAVEENDYTYSEATKAQLDAEWRAANNAPANKGYVTGPSDQLTEYNAQGKRACVYL